MILCIIASAQAQDPEFSQYYSAPLYLNPAFCGSADGHRFIANYRNQWPNISNGFVTSAFSYDAVLDRVNSGVGVLLTLDKAGSAAMKSTVANFQYAYRINFNDKWILANGLNFGIGRRSIDYNKLVFGDQLAFDADGSVPTDDPDAMTLQGTTYFDFGAGTLFYSRKVWVGASVMHLNRPNRSLLNQDAEIPIKTSFHGGVRLPLYHGPFKYERVAAIAPSFIYKRQGNFDQLDLGSYFLYEPLVIGLWYRGIPIEQNVKDNIDQDAVVVILGFEMESLELSYSYDMTISHLGSLSGGAHELSLRYKLDIEPRGKPKKIQKRLPCPTYPKGM